MLDGVKKNEKLRNRVETAALVVVVALILLLGIQVSEWVRDQNALTRELLTWAQQQRTLMLRQAQQQGLVTQEELKEGGENTGPTEAVGGGATPRGPQ